MWGDIIFEDYTIEKSLISRSPNFDTGALKEYEALQAKY